MSRRAATAAFVYFCIAFAAGFLFALPRTLFVEPRFTALGGVFVEAPFMLAVCWFAAGFALRRFAPGAALVERVGMGALWLVLLLAAEFGVGLWARGLSRADALAAFFTPPGLAGLVLQALCAAFPALRR